MTLARYLRSLRIFWPIVVVATLVGLALGAGSALVIPKTYESSSTIFVNVSQNETVQDLQMGEQFAQNRAASYAAFGTSSRVLEPVAEELGDGHSASSLAEQVIVTNSPNTATINVTGTAGDPQEAAAITQATAQSLVSLSAQLEGASDEADSPVKLNIMQAAQVPSSAAAPSLSMNILVGAVVGMVVGLLIVLAKAASRDASGRRFTRSSVDQD